MRKILMMYFLILYTEMYVELYNVLCTIICIENVNILIYDFDKFLKKNSKIEMKLLFLVLSPSFRIYATLIAIH